MDRLSILAYWIQDLFSGVGNAFEFLTSKPFADIPALANVTPLSLITIGGLIIFIGIAVVKWVIS